VQILNKLKQADQTTETHVRLERHSSTRSSLSCFRVMRLLFFVFNRDAMLTVILQYEPSETCKAIRQGRRSQIFRLCALMLINFSWRGLLKKVNIMHADIKPDNILVCVEQRFRARTLIALSQRLMDKRRS